MKKNNAARATVQPRRLLRAARFRVMPLTMAMLCLLFVAKINDVYWNSRQLSEFLNVRDAKAAEPDTAQADAKPDTTETKEPAAEAGHAGEGQAEKPPEEPKTYGAGKLTVKQVEALKAKEATPSYTQTEIDLLQNLSKRREEIDKRAEELDIKATVLEATEKRINDRIGEMKSLQTELGNVVAEYKKQQDGEIKSLVKIYESMKPTDAAAIFNELDMTILLEVIDKMSERKVAPVLAGMNPKRARDVTQELAELRKGRQRLNAAANSAAAAAPAR